MVALKRLRMLLIILVIIFIGMLITMMIWANFFQRNDGDTPRSLEEYPSGMIEDHKNVPVSETLTTNSGLKPNDTAPDFQLKNIAGEMVRLSDYKGKKVLLNFWASWCNPCIEEMPHIQQYYEENGNTKNIEVIGVNMGKVERGGIEKVKEFINDHQLTFPILVDEKDGKVMDLYKVSLYPTTYIINEKGVITEKIIAPLDEETIHELMN